MSDPKIDGSANFKMREMYKTRRCANNQVTPRSAASAVSLISKEMPFNVILIFDDSDYELHVASYHEPENCSWYLTLNDELISKTDCPIEKIGDVFNSMVVNGHALPEYIGRMRIQYPFP